MFVLNVKWSIMIFMDQNKSITTDQIKEILLDRETRGLLAEAWIMRQQARFYREESERLGWVAREKERQVQTKHNLNFIESVALMIAEKHLFDQEQLEKNKSIKANVTESG